MNRRVVITSWDWHYRVGFDRAMAQEIQSVANGLGSTLERHILLQQLDVFSSMVSISALCDALEETPDRFQELLAGINIQRLLYVPQLLTPVLKERISNLPDRLASEKIEIAALVDMASALHFTNFNKDIFDPVFGAELNGLTRRGIDAMPSAPEDKFIEQGSLQESVKSLLTLLTNRSHIQAILGETPIPDFDVVLREGPGFAEYWPAELLRAKSNQLIVYENPDQLRLGTLQTTLAHEVLGHGVFYELESRYSPPLLDHGAMCLIEGWATWCEWNASSTPHGRYFRSARLYGLRHFYKEDVDDLLVSIPKDIRKLGYSEAAVSSGLMYFFQYPGFSLSYTLGALWFENKFQKSSPTDFLKSLDGRPWGDFFKAW